MQPIEIDSKYISIMEFREKLIMEELEQYAKTLTGEGESILPFIRDENGNYSEEKTWKFIGELTEYAHVYWEYYQECQRQSYRENSSFSESDIEMLAGPSASFSQDEKDFLQNFFLLCDTGCGGGFVMQSSWKTYFPSDADVSGFYPLFQRTVCQQGRIVCGGGDGRGV